MTEPKADPLVALLMERFAAFAATVVGMGIPLRTVGDAMLGTGCNAIERECGPAAVATVLAGLAEIYRGRSLGPPTDLSGLRVGSLPRRRGGGRGPSTAA